MQEFTIIDLTGNKYKMLIFLNSFEIRNNYLSILKNELMVRNVGECTVLIDTILCQGNNKDRYVEVHFNGETFVESTIKRVNISKKDNLRRLSMEYMRDNEKELLKHSLLTSIQKRMLSKGIVI